MECFTVITVTYQYGTSQNKAENENKDSTHGNPIGTFKCKNKEKSQNFAVEISIQCSRAFTGIKMKCSVDQAGSDKVYDPK